MSRPASPSELLPRQVVDLTGARPPAEMERLTLGRVPILAPGADKTSEAAQPEARERWSGAIVLLLIVVTTSISLYDLWLLLALGRR